MVDKKGVIVRFYRFTNRLKEKTAGLAPGAATISADALAEAEQALSKMSEDYPDWVQGLIVKLQEQHGRSVDTPEKRREFMEEISRIAHDMKGQGGTFGYPLITDFADSLYSLTQGRKEVSDNLVELVKSHVDAMRAVIRGRVSGDGGEIGKKLTQTLNEAIDKYSE